MRAMDATDVALSGRSVIGVFQQDDALVSDVFGVVAAAEGIGNLGDGRIVDDAVGEHAAQDAMDCIVEAGHGHLVDFDRGLERIAKILGARLLLIEAGERGFDGGVRAAPVGNHEALEVEVFLENLVEEVVAFAGPVGGWTQPE